MVKNGLEKFILKSLHAGRWLFLLLNLRFFAKLTRPLEREIIIFADLVRIPFLLRIITIKGISVLKPCIYFVVIGKTISLNLMNNNKYVRLGFKTKMHVKGVSVQNILL